MPDDIEFFYVGGGVTTLTHIADTHGSNAGQVAVSGSALAGDLGVMWDWAVGVGSGGPTPSGWALAATVSGTGGEARIYAKELVSGDIGATITGLNAGGIRRQTISIFRPDDDIDSIFFGSGGGYSGLGDPPDQIVAAAAQPTPVLVAAVMFATGTIDIASSPGFDATLDNPATDSRAGYKVYNVTPADHTISATGDGGSKALLSCYIRVS